MTDLPEPPIDLPECWEITPCHQCPDEGTPACPEVEELDCQTCDDSRECLGCINNKEV